MDLLLKQLRYVLRSLGRAPAFTLTSVLTLALGIGATVAVFSVVHGVLLKPLPFARPDRLVGVWHEAPGLGWKQLNQAPALYLTYREESQTFVDTGLWDNGRVTVTGRAEPEVVQAMRVTDGTLPLLGIEPELGRLFTREDDSPGTPETVVLANGYWRRHFGGDPGVLGQALSVDGEPRTVIGVLPADTRFLDYHPDLYLPFRLDRKEIFFGNFSYQGVARLRDGVSVEQANADVARMIPMAIDRFPMPPGFSKEMVVQARLGPDVHLLKQDVVGDVGKVLWVLFGTVGIVLLVACANVANLLLVRAEARHQQLALRAALGAGRRSLARELLLESLVLGLAGGVAGVGLASAGLRLLVALDPRGLPRLDEITLDPTVLAFALALSVVAPLVFGLLPVARLKLADMVAALKEEGRSGTGGTRSRRARDLLVASQVALALVLMIGSGLMVRSFLALRDVRPGLHRSRAGAHPARTDPRGRGRQAGRGGPDARADPREAPPPAGRRLGGDELLGDHGPARLERSDLRRGPPPARGTDPAAAALQVGRPRLLRDHGQPAPRRPRHLVGGRPRAPPTWRSSPPTSPASSGKARPPRWASGSGSTPTRPGARSSGSWATSATTASTGTR